MNKDEFTKDGELACCCFSFIESWFLSRSTIFFIVVVGARVFISFWLPNSSVRTYTINNFSIQIPWLHHKSCCPIFKTSFFSYQSQLRWWKISGNCTFTSSSLSLSSFCKSWYLSSNSLSSAPWSSISLNVEESRCTYYLWFNPQ